MRYTMIKTYPVPELMLGTVGLGLRYGIANKIGQPKPTESLELLDFAYQSGITALDTARSYGEAEDILGAFLRSGNYADAVVMTKFKLTPSDLSSYDRTEEAISESVQESLQRLGLQRLPVLLLHMSRELELEKTVLYTSRALHNLKEKGIVDVAGVSIDHPREVEAFLREAVFEVYQLPLNVLDLRLTKTGILDELARSGKTVIARSVFLQGLLFMDPGELTGSLKEAATFITTLQQLAQAEGMSVAAFAFSYVRHLPGVASIVFGAEQPQQVAANLKLLDTPLLSEKARAQIEAAFASLPEHLITPRMWAPSRQQ